MILALVVAAACTCTAAAGAKSYSKGDAQAVFEAFGNGGWAILNHAKANSPGAPAQALPGEVAIRPFSGTGFDGAHYCALDWRTIVIADIEPGPHDSAAAAIADERYVFTLDGVRQQTTQTAVKRFLNAQAFGLSDAFYAQWGRTVAPSELKPGTHTLGVVATDAAGVVQYTDGITFYVDASGTGACLK